MTFEEYLKNVRPESDSPSTLRAYKFPRES
jgi:hypothetical protein